MTIDLLGSLRSFQQLAAGGTRMIPAGIQNRMVKVVNDIDEFRGCRIALYGNDQCATLDDGVIEATAFANVMVMFEEIYTTDAVVNSDTLRWANTPGGSPAGVPSPKIITNESRLSSELVGMGVSCGLTVVSVGLVVAGGAFAIPTGGAAIALFVAGWAGLAASALECGNAIARSMEASEHPNDDSLSTLDNDKSYQAATLIVDAIGVASAVASLPASYKSLVRIMKTQRTWAAMGMTEEALKGKSRADRLQLIRKLIEEASRTPEGKQAIEEALKAAKLDPRNVGSAKFVVTKGAAKTIAAHLSADSMRKLRLGIITVLTGGAGPLASGQTSDAVGSASGIVNVIVHILDGSGG